MSEHTPGPWVVHEKNYGCKEIGTFVDTSGGQCRKFCSHAQTDGLNNEAEDLANAKLIAAAPALLEAAKGISRDIYAIGGAGLSRMGDIEALEAAIAAATKE